MRIKPTSQSREQRGKNEGDEADAEDVDAEACQEDVAAAQASHRAALAGIEQIGARQHREADDQPDQIVDRLRRYQRRRENRDRRDAGHAGVLSEAYDVTEYEINRNAPG